MRSCWRRPGRRRWTTGARGPRPSCPSGSERGPARSLEIPSPLTMRTRDRLRLLRALRRRKRRKKRKTRRRRKRRNKCDTTDSQEEQPNHLKNCSLYSQLSPFDCALKNKYFVFILSWRCHLKLKTNFNFIFKRCLSSYQLSKFYHSDASVNWSPLDLKTKQRTVFFLYHLTLQLHVPWAFPKFNKDEKVSIKK